MPSDARDPEATARASASYEIDNLAVSWKHQFGRDGEGECEIEGLGATRGPQERTLHFRRAHCRQQSVSLEVERARALATSSATGPAIGDTLRDPSATRPWTLSLERLRVEVDVGGRATTEAVITPQETIDSAKPRARSATATATQSSPNEKDLGAHDANCPSVPKNDGDKGGVSPRAGRPGATRVAEASTAGQSASSEPRSQESPAELLRQILTSSHPGALRRVKAIGIDSTLTVNEVSVRLVNGDQRLSLGPWLLHLARDASGVTAELAEKRGGQQLAVSGSFRLLTERQRSEIRVAIGPTSLQHLGVNDGDFGLKTVERARVRLTANVTVDAKVADVVFETEGEVDGIAFRQPWLAKNDISGLNLSWSGRVELDNARRTAKFVGLRVGVGAVSARLDGTLGFGTPGPDLDASFEIPIASCQNFLDALPTGLAPMLSGWRVDGTFGLKAKVHHLAARPEQASVKLGLDNHCRIGSVPLEIAPRRFAEPFVLEVEDESRTPQPMSFGPGTWTWTPLAEISPYVESAVLVCEDGRFPYHSGIDLEALQNALRENLRSGRFARGGSTISMQLAKNLYLRRDKTLSRKLQEAGLTLLLEQSFSKRQLLELYLNVIEYGPGIYGIGPAARHYFNTTPDGLTLSQAFFLGSLLPNPKAQHFGADGLLKPGWLKQLRYLMTIAAKRGHLTEAELAAGLQEHPAFKIPGEATAAPSRRTTFGLPDDAEGEVLPVPEE